MNSIEMIEAVREMANVSYETAKEILENVNWDMDLAKEALRKEGYIKDETIKEEKVMNDKKNIKAADTFKEGLKSAAEWLGNLFKKGMENNFCIDIPSGKHYEIPVSILAVLMIAGCGLIPILLIIAFFSGCSFSFKGSELGTEKINDTMAKVKFTAEN